MRAAAEPPPFLPMQSIIVITSRHNERYKALVKSFARQSESGRIILEGRRLVEDALASGIEPDLLIGASDREEDLRSVVDTYRVEAETLILPPDLFRRLADTVNPQGVIMTAAKPEYGIDRLIVPDQGHYLLLDSLADPGNVGALSRSAEAFGFGTLVYKAGAVSPLSRKALRASMGSVLRQRVVRVDNTEDALRVLIGAGVTVYALDAGGRSLSQESFERGPYALIVGNEAHGLSDSVKNSEIERLSIPMRGNTESLNAAVAGAIVMYEIGKHPCK
ncbi:MAG TPA: RNA methyltransferase [Clostridiaceae bacterium]|nr:RNA methyltransferase [Clostridiaceae bacterium]